MSSSSDFPAIQINGVSQTITGPGEGGVAAATAYNGGINWDDSSYGFGSALTYSRNGSGDINRDNSYYQNVPIVNGDQNNGVKNCRIALMSIGDGGGHAHPDSHHIFPGELLTVAGTTTIGRHLGIRQTIPQYPLDVTGDINFTGELRKDGVIQTFGGGGGTSSSSNTFVAQTGSTAGVYPLSAMDANSSGVHVASASSESPSDWKAWKAFNQTIGDEGWHTTSVYNSGTGNYSGSTSTTYDGSSTVSGEWIQLQFTVGSGIAINKIEIAPRTGYLNRCAGDGRILGSTDGSTWTSISTFSGKTYSTGSYTSITFTLSSVYTYFRLVVTKLSGTGADTLNIGEIRYTGGDVSSNYIYYPEVGTNKNVGINTSSPEAMLHVNRQTSTGESNVYIQAYGDTVGNRAALFLGTSNVSTTTSQPKCAIIADAVGYSRADLHFCVETTADNGSAYRASTSNSRMMIDGTSGCVGIGTTSPTQAKLVVNGSVSTSLSYGWLNSSGNTGTASGTNPYSIYANQRIAGVEFNAHSDSRIKKNVVDINDSSALDKIRLLEPKIYNYIDEKQRGTSNVYGFIAQEVSNVLPYAVTVSTGDIPNILTNSNVSVTSDSNILELRLDTTVEGLTLSNTSNINITTDKDQYLTVPVLTFSGSNVITIQNSDTFSNVTGAYIHGEQVSNFHHLNKDAIWAVSTAALQEVDRQLQAEKTKVATLQTQVADLLTRVTALENN